MPNPILVEKIYIHVCVQCERPHCNEVLIPDTANIGNEKSSDPIDAWAVSIAVEAEALGWKIDENDAAVCPVHTSECAA